MDNKQIVARFGSFTSSEIGRLLVSGTRPMTEYELKNRVKGDKRKTIDVMFGDGAMTYINEKIAELLTGEQKQSVSNYAVEWGTSCEPKAMKHYIDHYQKEGVIYYGGSNFKYFEHPEIKLNGISFAGGSPDFVTPDAVGEIKCPMNSSKHVEILKAYKLNPDEYHNSFIKKYDDIYYAQLQWNMECVGLDKGLFISYDPRVQEMKHAMAVLRITKDNDMISDLKIRLHAALQIMSDFLTS